MKKIRLLSVLLLTIVFSNKVRAQNENAYPLTNALWRTSEISVCWDNPTDQNKHYRDLVKDAIEQTWQKYSALKFTKWCSASEQDCDIHIFINDEGPHCKGLGTEIKNIEKGMVLNFTFQNWSKPCGTSAQLEFCIKAIAVHEFGHALGFAHEQNRKDCHFNNCFNQEQGGNGNWYMTSCDLQSIMNYCNPRWNNNGLLSAGDISAVQYLYGQPAGAKSMAKEAISSVQNTQYVGTRKGSERYNVKIYLFADKETLDDIKLVTYDLSDADGTFANPIMTNSDRYSNFGIELLKVWGAFDIKITAKFRNGTSKEVIHHLTIP